MKIAVSGKGGVGKTLISAALAKGFADRGLKTIAIDADSSPNLALTLGLSAEKMRNIIPVSENKELITSKTNTGYSGVYRLTFSVDDIVRDYSIMTPFGVSMMVMGTVQSMGSGCMCAPNAVIRELLRHLIVERDEAVVLDMEAGVEHIGRGTAKHVDVLLVVTDSNLKALEIGKKIKDLAEKSKIENIYFIANRVMTDSQKNAIETFAQKNEIPILHFIPFDQGIIEKDMKGISPLSFKKLEAIKAIDEISYKLINENI